MKITRYATTLTAIAVAALLLAACGGGGDDESSGGSGGAGAATIRYQTVPGVVNPVEIASHLGYLGEMKLEPEGINASGPAGIQAVATDQIDVSPAFNVPVVKAIAAGAPVKSVIGGSVGSDADTYWALVVADDSPISSARDMPGAKIGVSTLGGIAEAWIKLWLKQEGLSPDEIGEVEFVVIPPINAEQALRQGQLDGIALLGQLLELAESKGGLRTVVKDTDVLGDYTATSYVMRDEMIESDPETTRALVDGIAKAIDYLQKTPVKKVIQVADETAAEFGRPEDKEALEFWKSQGIANQGGVLQDSEFSTWTKLMEEEGELDGGVESSDLYTNEFNPYAGKKGGGGG